MIAERIPAIADLTLAEKRTLMNELWDEVERAGLEKPDPALVALLAERWKQYEADPGSTITLEEFRKRLKRA